MPGDSEFSGLVEAIYDAGLQPALWNDVVVRINEFVGGRACGLFSKDSISKSGVTHYYCGADLTTFTSIQIPIPDSIR
jgi:hypothetical protein